MTIEQIISLLVAINAWQLYQLYTLNRELGEIKLSASRIASDSESEKATRARVNKLILQRLGCRDCDIEATNEPPKPTNKPTEKTK